MAFGTLGDGDCQHTDNRRVEIHEVPDLCHSIASAILAPGADVQALFAELMFVRHRGDGEEIAFARSLAYVEGKDRWFNPASKAVSSSRAKANDRRWHPITPAMNGGMESTIRILLDYYHFDVMRIVLSAAERAMNHDVAYDRFWSDLVGSAIGIAPDNINERQHAMAAASACILALLGLQFFSDADCYVKSRANSKALDVQAEEPSAIAV